MNWRFLILYVLILLTGYSCIPQSSAVESPQVDGVLSSPTESSTTQSENAAMPKLPDQLQSPDPTSSSTSAPSERIPRITIEELLQKIKNSDNILVVDSRADVEQSYVEGHIKGAILVSLSKITAGQWEPPPNKNLEIVFYCT